MKPPTGCPPKTPTQRPLKPSEIYAVEPPDGMWFEHRAGRALPFLARWRSTDGAKVSQSFESPAARSEFASDWVRQRTDFGKAVKLVDQHTMATLAEFRRLVGDAHMLQVAREWLAWRGTNDSIGTAEAWAEFNAVQEARKLSGDTHNHRRLHGKRLVTYFTGVKVAAIRTEQVEAWLASLMGGGEPMAPKTKANHLKTARHFFDFLKDRRKIHHNPCDAVALPDATELDPATGEPIHKEINVLSVEQCRQLFAANANQLCIGRLALEAFGGLRYTSAARLRPADIDWEEKGVILPGHQHKSTKRHYVDGWPENLWLWMRHAPVACWDINKRQYADLKREAFERAGLKPPAPPDDRDWTPEEVAQFEAMKNALRHGFATHHLAAFKDAKLTAELMTKTSIRSLKNDYQGRASRAAGLAWFEIAPPA